jgi:hypothetical protein
VEERLVSREALVSFEGNRYAVPWRFVGRHVVVSSTAAHVKIRDRSELVIVRARSLVSGLTLPLPGQYDGASLGLAEAAARLDAGPSSEVVMPNTEFLIDLLGQEPSLCREPYLLIRTKLARFPFKKTLEQFDFDAQPCVDRK